MWVTVEFTETEWDELQARAIVERCSVRELLQRVGREYLERVRGVAS